MKVDVGAVATDIVSQCEPEAQAPTVLGGVLAREVVTNYDPEQSDGATRAHAIAAIINGYCVVVGAIFAQDIPDEETFLQIASSFTFSE